MSRYETFDDFNTSEQADAAFEQPPFQFREDTSMDGTLKWLNSNFQQAEKQSHSRLRNYIRWSYLYKGVHWRNIGRSSYRNEYGAEQESKKPKMVDNYIWELIDHKISQMSRLGTAIACIPWNDEQSDVNNAKACEKLLKARFIDMDMDKVQDDADLIKFKYGTVFQFATWNKDIGPTHKSFEEIEKIYKGDIPKKVLKRLSKQEAFKIGDADLDNVCPWQVQPELFVQDWKKVNHVDYIPDWTNIHELKAIYPKKANEILENQSHHYDFSENIVSQPTDMVQVRHFFHKKTKWLPEGAHIVYTEDVILDWKNLEYKHGELPLVVDRDIEIEKELWGRPKITNIEQKQRQTNNIESAVARDLGVGSAPKWLFPKGAVTFKTAGNEFSIMEYKGPREPKLVQNNPVSEQALNKLDANADRMAKLMKVYDVSLGKTPPGIEANAALRFLDEQEDQANESDKKKRKTRVVKTSRQMVSIMGQYYDESDNRTSRILGKNNEYMISNLKSADFSKVYDVNFQNTSSMPDTKTGKIATIIDMNMATQTDPVFKTPQIVKMLDLGMDEQYTDRVTASTNAANSIFELLIEGVATEEPAMHDDLLIYYNIFYQRIQDFGFKSRIKGELREAVFSYILTLEGLLWEKSKSNQKVMAELQQMDFFPAFFKPDIADPSLTSPDYVGKEPTMDAGKMENTEQAISESIEKQPEQ